jgi:hypothetical protein
VGGRRSVHIKEGSRERHDGWKKIGGWKRRVETDGMSGRKSVGRMGGDGRDEWKKIRLGAGGSGGSL